MPDQESPRVLSAEELLGALDSVSWGYRQALRHARATLCPTEARRALARRRRVYREALDLVLAQAEWSLAAAKPDQPTPSSSAKD